MVQSQSNLDIFLQKNVSLKKQTSYISNYLDMKKTFVDFLNCVVTKYIVFATRSVIFLFQIDNWIMRYRDKKFGKKVVV